MPATARELKKTCSELTVESRQSHMTSSSEREARWRGLMAESQKGDKDSYHTLLTELEGYLTNYCARSLGNLGLEKDCVQECLIAVHRSRHTYNPERPFQPWLFTIVRHKIVDQLRKLSRLKKVESSDSEVVERAVDQRRIDTEEAQQEVRDLLASLTPKYRDALVMTKLHGLSVSEAARELAISESALKVRVHRALNQIRKKILDDLATDPG